MALIKCKECGTEVSDKATSCTKCGAPVPSPRKKTGIVTWAIVGILGIGFVRAITLGSGPTSTPSAAASPPPPTEAQKLEESDRLNTAALVLTVKKAAKDPDSFKLHSAMATKEGTSCIEYSATNSFNARLRGIAVVARGKTEISEAAATWNKLCAHKENTDYTDLFQRTLFTSE
jgi:hypothetical protein